MNPLSKIRLLFGAAAFVSFLFSVSLWFGGFQQEGVFVGLWVPSILALGSFVCVSRPERVRRAELARERVLS